MAGHDGSAGDSMTIPDRYEPAAVEARWYPEWEKRGYFHAEADDPRPPYCIVIPPPNVTGSLHMGHALVNTLGHPDPHEADGRVQRAVDARHRSRGHRDPVRRRAPARRRGEDERGP